MKDKIECNTCRDDNVNKKDVVCGKCYRQECEMREELQNKINNLLNALRDMRCEG